MLSLRGFAIAAAGALLVGVTSSGAAAVRTTSADTQAPSAPSGLAASDLSSSAATLSWAAATDDVAVTGYDVLRDGVKVGALTGSAAGPPGTTLTDVGLAADTDFAYTVIARDAQGNT